MGFAFGFQGPQQSTMTSSDIQPEDADAFEQGVLAGQDAAISGLSLPQPCIDLNAEGGFGPHLALELPEGIMVAKELLKSFGKGIGGGVIFLINLSIALETFTDDPDQKLTQAASALQAEVQEMGFNQSTETFIGGGVDLEQRGCELLLTPIFRFRDSATNAAQALGRLQWLVASWRTDQSGGASIVASSGNF
jgi:hypothetical protein